MPQPDSSPLFEVVGFLVYDPKTDRLERPQRKDDSQALENWESEGGFCLSDETTV